MRISIVGTCCWNLNLNIISAEIIAIMFAVIFASILLLDELLTFGAASFFGRGGGLGFWLLFIAYISYCRPKLGAREIIVIVLMLMFSILSIEEIDFSSLYLTSLILCLGFASISLVREIPILGSKAFMVALSLVLVGLIFSILGLDLFEIVSGVKVNRPTGFYSEPSHLAFYVSILYLLATFCRPKDRKYAGAVSISILIFTFSASALLPLVIILTDLVRHSRRKKLILLLSCGGVFGLILYEWEYLLERNLFAADDSQSLTLQTLFYYYALLLNHLKTMPLIGFGPDQFQRAYAWYSYELGRMPADLNSTDGSFLAVKLLVEFGLLFSILFLAVIYFRIFKARAVAFGLLMSQFIFLRGFGVTSSVVIGIILAVIAKEFYEREPNLYFLTSNAKNN